MSSQQNGEPPLILRLVNESSIIANAAAGIVRRVLRSGELDVVDKVKAKKNFLFYFELMETPDESGK